MTRFEQLEQMLTEHGGMLQTTQVTSEGISKPVFYNFIREKNLEQVAHGVYVSKDTWVDAMFLIHLRCGQAVFSRPDGSGAVTLFRYGEAGVQSFTAESGWDCGLYDQTGVA